MAGIAPLGPIVHPDTGSRRGIGVWAFVLALVTAGAMAHVGVRMKGIEVAYELGHEKRVNTQLEEERRRLNIEIGMLKDPVRVVSIARDKLKMGPPAPTDIVRLAPGQILGAGPAEHAAAPAKRPERATGAAKARASAARAARPTEVMAGEASPEPQSLQARASEPTRAEPTKTEPTKAEPTKTEPATEEAPVGAAPAREGDE